MSTHTATNLTDTGIRAFQRSGVDSLTFALCTLAIDGNDAERVAARIRVAAAMNGAGFIAPEPRRS